MTQLRMRILAEDDKNGAKRGEDKGTNFMTKNTSEVRVQKNKNREWGGRLVLKGKRLVLNNRTDPRTFRAT